MHVQTNAIKIRENIPTEIQLPFYYLIIHIFLNVFSPYSPDFNPIESAFGLAKQMLRRNQHLTHMDPKYCLARALEQVHILKTLLL